MDTFFSHMPACSIPTKTNTRGNMTVNYIFYFIFLYFYHMIKIILIIEFSYTPKASFVFTSNALLAWSSKRECLFPLWTEVTLLHFLHFIRSNEPSPYLTSPQISDNFNGCPQNLQPSISLFTTYPSSIARMSVNYSISLSHILLSSSIRRISLSTSSSFCA